MGESRSIATCLVGLLLCMSTLAILVSAHHPEEVTYNLVILQDDGTHFPENILLTGTTTLAPSEATWQLWNVGDGLSGWNLEELGSHFSDVVPVSENLWNWTLEINDTEINCTCLLTISIPNGLDPMTKSIIVYLGVSGHRPMILDIEYATTIIVDQPISIEIEYVTPGINNSGVTAFTNICEAPHGVCFEEFHPLIFNQSDNDGTVTIMLDSVEMGIEDGIFQLEFYITDSLLLNSNTETLAIVIDTHAPIVNLSGVEQVNESQSIFISAFIDDGYSGSSENIVWTIHSPDGKVRSPTNEEFQDEYSLILIPTLSGEWTVDLLVRDIGGHFVTTSHSFNVSNRAPQAHLTLDGFEVHNGSSLTPANADNWVLNGSASTDTLDDMHTLQYVWYIDGNARLSGKSTFTQADYSFSGYEEVILVVTDDDGVESRLNFTIFVEEEQSVTKDSLIVIGIVVLSLLLTGLLATRKMIAKSRDSASSKGIPKWGEGKNVAVVENDESPDYSVEEDI
ncbi:MAG: hypothetical protein OR994_06360 [Candidatus Poseidoniales archaeon]|nr:hypothetical protein [Candidatus Poseidoniales archaeon]